LVGYPGTVAATRQQSGRAGRTSQASLSVMVTSADALDQFLAHHPEYLMGRSPEHALINPDNLLILLQHLRCASFELPFRSGDHYGNLPIELIENFLQVLTQTGELHFKNDRYFWMADQYPATAVSLRSASPENVFLQVQQEGEWATIGQVDVPSAPWLVHPGAIYLHEGQMFEVDTLDLEGKTAQLHSTSPDYYTEPQTEVTVQGINVAMQEPAPGCTRSYGEIQVTSQLKGFRKIRWYTHEHLGYGEATLPPTTLQTTAYWLTLTDETVKSLEDLGLWTNAPNDYGPSWPLIRDLVRKRDGYRCQLCGLPESGRQHHVHHKVPFRTFISREQANQLNNLITLCPNCHRKAEMNVKMRSGLAGVAYAFSQLAPLFVMSDSRDLGVHSDPVAPLGDGKPTIVVYDLVPAGIGLSERLFEIHADLIQRAQELVAACACSDGCPSCIGPAGENGMGGKRETLALLRELVAADALPVET
jgi:DEAD/DEAH box helicase domain-containing protein